MKKINWIYIVIAVFVFGCLIYLSLSVSKKVNQETLDIIEETLMTQERHRQCCRNLECKTDVFSNSTYCFIMESLTLSDYAYSEDSKSIYDYIIISCSAEEEGKPGILFSMNPKDSYDCTIGNQSYCKIKFEDGEILKLKHDSSTSCDGGVSFSMALRERDIYNKFRTKKITNIRFVVGIQDDDLYDLEINEAYQDYFIEKLQCIPYDY